MHWHSCRQPQASIFCCLLCILVIWSKVNFWFLSTYWKSLDITQAVVLKWWDSYSSNKIRKPQNEICSCEFEEIFSWGRVIPLGFYLEAIAVNQIIIWWQIFENKPFQFYPIWIQFLVILLQLHQSVKFSLALKKVPLSIFFFCSTIPLTL